MDLFLGIDLNVDRVGDGWCEVGAVETDKSEESLEGVAWFHLKSLNPIVTVTRNGVSTENAQRAG